MFDQIDSKKQQKVYPFIEWLDRFVLTDENLRQARDEMYEFEAQVSQLSQIHRTPQSANHHAEGPFMTNHLEGMLAALHAICEGHTSLLQIEEFAREKHFVNEIAELEDVICENAATLKAFVLLHDIAKYDTISFSSPGGSLGAQEGFVADSKLAIDKLIDRYAKLLKVFKVENSEFSPRDLNIAFYNKYQISVHYKGHAKEGASDKYKQAREAVEDLCRLTARDRQMLLLLIRRHIEVIDFVNSKADGARYTYLQRVASKAGLDSDDVLDMQAAALLLDAVIGSIGYEDGRLVPDTELILNMFRSEELSAQERRQARVKKLEDKKQRDFKKMLKSVGLGGEEVFADLNIPFGPARAQIIEQIESAARTGDLSGLGQHKEKLYSKIQQAHLLYRSKME